MPFPVITAVTSFTLKNFFTDEGCIINIRLFSKSILVQTSISVAIRKPSARTYEKLLHYPALWLSAMVLWHRYLAFATLFTLAS